MKKLRYTFFLLLFLAACEQEVIELEPAIVVPPPPPCPADASAGSANFTKFVAIGSSYTAGFQAGALFNEGQNNSLGTILASRFSCAGGTTFNQPTINSEHGYNIFITPNPMGSTVLGRFKLQGTPPAPAPVISGVTALPNPQVNPAFMYTGSTGAVPVNQLNNFGVQALVIGQALIPQTGNWTLAGSDPRFNPFYARFASNPGTSTLLGDAISSLTNGGTFFSFWLGMDDVLLHAAFGGDPAKAPLTSVTDFTNQYNFAIGNVLANPTLKGVIANYPDLFVMPHFTAVPWNAIPLDAPTAANLTTNLANPYNAFLDGMVGATVITAAEAALRKLTYVAGQNAILLKDETLTDLTPYMQGPYAGLQPYAIARQTKSTDIIPLSAGGILGVEIAAGQVLGVSVPVADQYVLIPSESELINSRLTAFNAAIKALADANPDRLAFADVNQGMKSLVTATVGVADGVTFTPNINPPTGIYSEEGLHPNSRGYAFIANIFIDAINAKFGATIPKAKLGNYGATPLPINP
ncbi:MAG: hypothetical protein WD824_06625 [Cyclobacteriaceae bacterium]